MPAETINLIVTQDFNITTTMAFVDRFRVTITSMVRPFDAWAFLSEQRPSAQQQRRHAANRADANNQRPCRLHHRVGQLDTRGACVGHYEGTPARGQIEKKPSAHWIQVSLSLPIAGC